MGEAKIVRKASSQGGYVDFKLDAKLGVVSKYPAWKAFHPTDDMTAAICGTSLAALRAELAPSPAQERDDG